MVLIESQKLFFKFIEQDNYPDIGYFHLTFKCEYFKPAWLSRFTKMEILSLHGMDVKFVGLFPVFKDFIALTMDSNKLRTIPPLDNLGKLLACNFSLNNLTSLPRIDTEKIGSLYLSWNKLRTVPEKFKLVQIAAGDWVTNDFPRWLKYNELTK